MEHWLYVDNFRGFSETYIPIRDVNFLLGENSTGKTSMLALINLLGSPEFWIRQEFNTDRVQLGRFKDIASAKSDKKYFRIGVISWPQKGSRENVGEATLMTFTEEDNNPLICQYNHLGKQGEVRSVFHRGRIRYQFTPADSLTRTEEDALGIFKGWASEEYQTHEDYQILAEKTPFDRKRALLTIDRIMQRIYGETNVAPSDVFRFSMPRFASRLAWIAPIRSKPKRTYDDYQLDFNPEGEHTPYLIKKLLGQKSSTKDFRKFLEQFGNQSGLFETIDIKKYGRESIAPFQLNVVLSNIPLAIVNVGYGVSQALPVVVELFARASGSQFAIQQPEVHLHPKAQAALGDLIFRLARDEKKRFFVETHSDYTIDRFRMSIRKAKGKAKISAQVLFFERTPTGNRVIPIAILENGEYSDNQPKSFREFFILEELDLLGL